jgi:hypothetical protein
VLGRLSDLTFGLLLKRLNIRWEYCALDGLLEVVWPPLCGTHLVQLERDQTPAERRFAIRHAAGHVLAGDCAGMTHSHDGHDWRCREETVADGFGLIDLVSDVEIRDRLRAGWDWRETREWVEVQVHAHGPTWAEARVMRRTEDRLWLFVEREGRRAEETR